MGCSGVKFQLFKIEELFAPEILSRSQTHQNRKEWELPVDFLPHISKRCHEKDLAFWCTPFYLDAVQELLPFVDGFKIASYELLWRELLEACAKTLKPVILSTGMATMEEIENAVLTLREAGCKNLTLLHCISGYPAPEDQCNLAAIETLRKAFDCPTGWSDHSASSAVLHRAIHRWGADTIEFHLDLDGHGEEFKTGHCWLPAPMKQLIKEVNSGFTADGNGQKTPGPAELHDREWRADPSDGLRPLLHIRKSFHG
jgi:N-acetylneuraminate synthase